jgi:hypothetical protein
MSGRVHKPQRGYPSPRHTAHHVARRSLAIIAVMTAFLAKGHFTVASATCPSDTKSATLNQSRLPSEVLDVSTEKPCVATIWLGIGGTSTVTVTDPRPGTTMCRLTGHLEGGRQVAAVVTFGVTIRNGCRATTVSGDSFTLVKPKKR